MTRRERLTATLRGGAVDRPAVSFYEVGGWEMAPSNDEFTVWNDPSWRPLVDMALAETDLIRMVGATSRDIADNALDELTTQENWREGDSRFTRTTIQAGDRPLTSLTRRDKDTQTTWMVEHLLKNCDDAEAYLRLPEPSVGQVDVSPILGEEKKLGDSGIACIDAGDPICSAASLFSMENYTIIAMTEPRLFHRLLERFARTMLRRCEQLSKACPGRMWRICGSEYASEPFLPPRLFDEYVVRYTGRMVRAIQKHGGYARIHSHGQLRGILPLIAKMGVDGLDPLEPPPQGDMELWEIAEVIGAQTVLMGNIDAADIEMLSPLEFEVKVTTALREGTAAGGRGYILHPSACPYGRTISTQTMTNYETMLRLAKDWQG